MFTKSDKISAELATFKLYTVHPMEFVVLASPQTVISVESSNTQFKSKLKAPGFVGSNVCELSIIMPGAKNIS